MLHNDRVVISTLSVGIALPPQNQLMAIKWKALSSQHSPRFLNIVALFPCDCFMYS